jgi:hypothetical protein
MLHITYFPGFIFAIFMNTVKTLTKYYYLQTRRSNFKTAWFERKRGFLRLLEWWIENFGDFK